MDSFSQKYSAATGLSKIQFKRKLKISDADKQAMLEVLGVCGYPTGTEYDIGFTIGSTAGVFTHQINNVGDSFDCLGGATLDTGDCQIKMADNFDKVTGKLSIKCLEHTTVGVIYNVSLVINVGGRVHTMCFFNPAFYSNGAIVKTDGSDGKSIKMLNAPLSATCGL